MGAVPGAEADSAAVVEEVVGLEVLAEDRLEAAAPAEVGEVHLVGRSRGRWTTSWMHSFKN